MAKISFTIAVCILLLTTSLKAQEAVKAELYRVEDGVFQLREGKTIDLTDRFLLLAFRQGGKCLEITLNGRRSCIEVGKRFDLKWKHAPFHLGKLFQDKNRCFLDVAEISAPKGADATAIFRLHCI